MADSTVKSVLSAIATVNSKLSDLSIKDGQLIFVQDKSTIALDFGGKRLFYKQVEDVATEEARTSMLAPVNGHYYFVVETSVLWAYRNSWVQITMPPKDIKDYADSIAVAAAADATSKANTALENAKAYADNLSKRITCTIDEDGIAVVTFDEQLWTG